MTKIISVFGSSGPQAGSVDYEIARQVGNLLAQVGYTVQTGGYSGVMAAASQGASEAGGHVIGVTSSQIEQYRPVPPNQWVVEEKKFKTLRERLFYLIDHCDGAIVMPGGVGTLAELSLIWCSVQVGEIAPRPIVLFGEMWAQVMTTFINPKYIHLNHQRLISLANSAAEAVEIVRSA